jgi:hypothetical protein
VRNKEAIAKYLKPRLNPILKGMVTARKEVIYLTGKYTAFLEISKKLYEKFQVKPVLFGSLGLGIRLDIDLKPDDIDILLPPVFLEDKWETLIELMGNEGYSLFDLRERSFLRNGSLVSFASCDLDQALNIPIDEIPIMTDSGISYKLLTLAQYLAVYEHFLASDYRKNEKGSKDAEKIALIRQALMRKG